MAKSENNSFSSADYARTFRRLEKQFEDLAHSRKPPKRDIYATTVPAGRTLYSVIRKGFLDCLSPPGWLQSETLLPGLVDKEKQPKYSNWTPDEYSDYWIFAMQWLPTAHITSVPNNKALQWKKKKWDKELKTIVPLTYDNEADYIQHLQACATMYTEACNLITSILESENTGERTSQKTKQGETERNTTPAKRWGIKKITGWIFKGFIALTLLLICLYVFGVVTGIFIFASVLTCLHLLGYLEQFNTLIDKILQLE